MRRIDFKVPIYDWDITVVTLYNSNCAQDLSNLVNEFDLPNKEEIISLTTNNSFNGGRTYSQKNKRHIVVILWPWTSEEWFIKILNHEKRHIIDDIVEWHELHSSEASAYLDGFISQEIYKHINELK